MPEYVTIKWVLPQLYTGEDCVICDRPFTKRFPDDFPNNWKFCCACHACAVCITEGVNPNSHRFKKIYKRITLVGK